MRNRYDISIIDQKLLTKLKYLAENNQASTVTNTFGIWLLSQVNAQSVSKIVNTWKNDIHTLNWLKTIAQRSDMYIGIQSAAMQAVKELGRGWRNEIDTFSIIKTLALSYKRPNVQQVALQTLAEHWKDEPNTLSILKTCAQSSESFFGVRSEAITELACIWGNKDELFGFLYECAVNDPFVRKDLSNRNPRIRALQAIIKNYSNHPQTLPLLKDRAENDPDEKLRKFAQEKLKNFPAK